MTAGVLDGKVVLKRSLDLLIEYAPVTCMSGAGAHPLPIDPENSLMGPPPTVSPAETGRFDFVT